MAKFLNEIPQLVLRGPRYFWKNHNFKEKLAERCWFRQFPLVIIQPWKFPKDRGCENKVQCRLFRVKTCCKRSWRQFTKKFSVKRMLQLWTKSWTDIRIAFSRKIQCDQVVKNVIMVKYTLSRKICGLFSKMFASHRESVKKWGLLSYQSVTFCLDCFRKAFVPRDDRLSEDRWYVIWFHGEIQFV